MIKKLFSRKSERQRQPMFTNTDRRNIKWFWFGYMQKRTPWLLVVFGLILVQGYVYKQFLSMTQSGLRVIFDEGSKADLLRICTVVFALFAVRGVASYFIPRLSTWLASNAVLELRTNLVKNLMTLDLAYFDRTSPSDIMMRLVQQVEGLSQFVGQGTITAVQNLVMVVIISGYLLYLAPLLFLSVIVIAPMILLTLSYVSGRIKAVQRSAQNALGAFMNTLEETSNGIRTVKISNQERFEEARLINSSTEIRDLQIRLQSAQAVVLPAIDIASAFAYALVVGVGGYMALNPAYHVDGASIVTFMIGLVMVFDPLRNLAKFFTTLQSQLILLHDVRGMLKIKPLIVDTPDAVDSFNTTADIRFANVDFAYTGASPLFEDLSLSFEGGKRTAIVGATGSGKTTILSLLSRLYEVDGGQVLFGQDNVKSIRIDTLRQAFSVVAQDIVIFNASIWENIRYARPEATDAEIWTAAENAEIAELIRARGPEPLGPKGAQLSGGQKQRIAIARAFLRSAPILLLDEATSALDQKTEERVKGALDLLAKGKTTIIVAHRLSSIADCDKIYVLDGGRVVESGSHEDLVAHQGLYAGMYRAQKEDYR